MRIILGVTGCIAAYKAATVLRILQKAGCDVIPLMTRSATRFIAPLTLEKLSGHKVISELFAPEPAARIEHIALSRESHLLLVAPATANILGKFANGIADDFLSTLYLSTTTPVIVAPAMNVEMWNHPATQSNLKVLAQRGLDIVEPDSGYLACGEEGEGRLAEPEKIAEAALRKLDFRKSLSGKRVLVTAGPTVEDIDPVRFISNRSSGKMGYAVAREARIRGADVLLISGPTMMEPLEGVELVAVRSASEMAKAVFERFEDVDVVVMAAAVSDYSPLERSSEKIKKGVSDLSIRLSRSTDILKVLSERKRDQILIGFAAESSAVRENAKGKLRAKGLDMVVGNDISRDDTGFQADFNQVILISRDGSEESVPRCTKSEVARLLWDRIENFLTDKTQSKEDHWFEV